MNPVSPSFFQNNTNESINEANALFELTRLSNQNPNEPKHVDQGIDLKYLPLYKAAIRCDWRSAERVFKEDPDAVTTKLGDLQETALHVAVSTAQSLEFVRKLIDLMPVDKLGLANKNGDTALHLAAAVGHTAAVRILREKNSALVQLRNNVDNVPLLNAAANGYKETVCYLLSVTKDEDPSPFSGKAGVKLLNCLIIADFFDIAIYLLKRYPKLALEKDNFDRTALLVLATKPQAFASGNELKFWERLLSRFFVGNYEENNEASQGGDVENPVDDSEKYLKETKQIGFLKQVQNKILMHKRAMELLGLLIKEALNSTARQARFLVDLPVRMATIQGIHEFVAEIIKAYPTSIWFCDINGSNIFHLAIINRQEKVFNLLFQMSPVKIFSLFQVDKIGNNALHLTGLRQLSNKISGAALQMQRELQWFQAVEKVVQPSYKELKNSLGKSPKEYFTENHAKLVKEGEGWMKGTAESCTIVAALVVTVVFAAAFTVPGGNDQEQGTPIYLNEKSFMIFAVSDALALFSSATSLLMFLGILTSRCSEKDFLISLPRKLSIGLIGLFFSNAAMLVAFSESMHIVIFRRVNWIAVPFGLVACVPVVLFALL